jgi:hypothetical protein
MYRYWLLTVTCLLLGSCAAPPATLDPQAISIQVPNPTPSSTAATKGKLLAECPVTRPPEVAFVPPAPYPAKLPPEYAGQYWYGTPALWTMLGNDGRWGGLPLSAAGYSQKVFWWRQGYSMDAEPSPQLTVSGKRLDASTSSSAAGASAFETSHATNASADFGQAMLTGIEIPSPGCWEITGHYGGHQLSFVVWVEP